MPPIVPFLPAIAKTAGPLVAGLIGGKLGKKKGAASADAPPINPLYAKPLSEFGGSMLPMAQQGFKTAMDYYTPLAQGNEQALATATASDAASTARNAQSNIDRITRQMGRTGAGAALAGNIPFQQQSAGLERRIGAQQAAVQNIGALAGNAGQLGGGAFSTLIGGEAQGRQAGTQQGYLDLMRSRENRDYYGKLGGSIFDILSGVIPGMKGGGVKVPGAPGGFNLPGTGLPQGQVPPWMSDMWNKPTY